MGREFNLAHYVASPCHFQALRQPGPKPGIGLRRQSTLSFILAFYSMEVVKSAIFAL